MSEYKVIMIYERKGVAIYECKGCFRTFEDENYQEVKITCDGSIFCGSLCPECLCRYLNKQLNFGHLKPFFSPRIFLFSPGQDRYKTCVS